MEKSIVYKNRKFTLGSKGRYYFTKIKGVHWSLHRYKYTCEKGDIPEGWHIHHIDHNYANNDINNLQAIEPATHSQLHLPSKETMEKWQAAGIKQAPVWHASEEGNQWHKEHYDNIKESFHGKILRTCEHCGKSVETIRKKARCYCSNNCKSAWRRKNKPDKKTVECATCGKSFETLKYLPNTYCSLDCKPAPNPFGRKGKNINQNPLTLNNGL